MKLLIMPDLVRSVRVLELWEAHRGGERGVHHHLNHWKCTEYEESVEELAQELAKHKEDKNDLF